MAARTTLTRHTSRGLGASAWAWAYEHLLPSSSKTTVYNLWRYRQHPDPDPQRNATAATIDYAVQKNAFVLDHQTHLDTGGGPGMASCSQDLEAHPQADCSPGGISPWLNASEDACHKIGCCWHAHGLQPTGHMCVHPSYNSTTGCCIVTSSSLVNTTRHPQQTDPRAPSHEITPRPFPFIEPE